MKHCCGWCNKVYTCKKSSEKANPNKVFCSQGCLDADVIFRQLVKLQHEVYVNKRIPRISK